MNRDALALTLTFVSENTLRWMWFVLVLLVLLLLVVLRRRVKKVAQPLIRIIKRFTSTEKTSS